MHCIQNVSFLMMSSSSDDSSIKGNDIAGGKQVPALPPRKELIAPQTAAISRGLTSIFIEHVEEKKRRLKD